MIRLHLIGLLVTALTSCGVQNDQNSLFLDGQRNLQDGDPDAISDSAESAGNGSSDPKSEALDEDVVLSFRALSNTYAKKLSPPPPKVQWSKPKSTSPNIMFIMLDDLPLEVLGFSQQTSLPVKTPNIDKLRANGVYFDKFYIPIGQCGPSRAVFWTGLHPSTSGVQTNDFNDAILDPTVEVLPRTLKIRGGYRTGFFGKCHLGVGKDIISALKHVWLFDKGHYVEGAPWRPMSEKFSGTDFYESSVVSWNSLASPERIVNYGQKNSPGRRFYLDVMVDEILSFANKSSAAPFFAWFAPRAPHIHTLTDTIKNGRVDYHNAPPRFPGEVQRGAVTSPHISMQKGADTLKYKPLQQLFSSSAVWYWTMLASSRSKGGEATPVHEYIRRIYNQIGYFDHKLGVLVDELKKSGKYDNTIFILTADNGAFAGERNLIMKGPFMYDDLVKMPLIISGPGIRKNETINELTSSTDMAATVLELAGVSPSALTIKSPRASTRSFASLARGLGRAGARNSVFLEYESQRNVVSPIRGVVFKYGSDYYKFNHYLSSNYFKSLPFSTVSPNTGMRWVVELWNMFTFNRGRTDPLSAFLNSDRSQPPNAGFEVELSATSAFTYELYNLTKDPNELVNLLPFASGSNALERVLKENASPTEKPVVENALRILAEYQSSTQDNRAFLLNGFSLVNSGSSFALNFNSKQFELNRCTLSQGGIAEANDARNGKFPICYGPAQASVTDGISQLKPKFLRAQTGFAEVLLRKKGCTDFTTCVTNFRSDRFAANHRVTLVGLDQTTDYEGVAYVIGASGNGGAQRFNIQQGKLTLIQEPQWKSAFLAMNSEIRPSKTEPQAASSLAQSNRTCSIFSGRGALIAEKPEQDVNSCDNICNSYSSRVNRFCIFGTQVFQKPSRDPLSSKGGVCTVTGQAGNILKQWLYWSFTECRITCNQYTTTNPKRHCQYGPARFVHAGESVEHFLQNL